MDIAIVDDETYFREKEKELLSSQKEYQIFTFASTNELIKSDKTFDVLLLDIEMPDDNGIEFAEKHICEFPHIIFITSHNELVYDAFNCNINGFIVKRKLETDLIRRIKQVEVKIRNEKSITLPTKTGHKSFPEHTIHYFCIEYDCIYMITDKKIDTLVDSFRKLNKMLSDTFFQISRKEIIHLRHIENIYKSNHTIEMINGDTLKVSERKWKAFKEAYFRMISHD